MLKDEIGNEVFYGILLALGSFLLAMFLTPIYTYFAYKYKFWKKQKKVTIDGKALPVVTNYMLISLSELSRRWRGDWNGGSGASDADL